MKNLICYKEINQQHEAFNFKKRTDLDGFHIFTFADTYPDVIKFAPPHQRGFYQIIFAENAINLTTKINSSTFENKENILLVNSPLHVLSFTRGENIEGYILYFKESFISPFINDLQLQFPYFNINEINSFLISDDQKQLINSYCKFLLQIFSGNNSNRVSMLQYGLISYLFACKSIYDDYEKAAILAPKGQQLTAKFLNLISTHFLEKKTVEEYAAQLNITASHLNDTVKDVTGKNAKSFIVERIMTEAKKYLDYSEMNVNEIAYYLGFTEPTHFTRFFKSNVSQTPIQYREKGNSILNP
jgi:AraC family transcriptional regulator, transcriptional activator of pobA